MLWEPGGIRNVQFFLFENSKEDLGHLMQSSYDVSGSGPEELKHYLLYNYLKSNLLVYGTKKMITH